MNAAAHLRFGYAVQVTSLLTLALVNIALPNWIGATEFARLNEAYAFVGFSCMIFNEGVALLVIRAIGRAGEVAHRARDVALQGAFEHVLIALAALAVVIAVAALLAPHHHYGATDWALVAFTDVVIALYVTAIAWLTARLQNRIVALLALAQGLLSFLLPLGFVAAGQDVRWAIAGSHVVGLAACVVLMRRTDRSAWRPTLACSSLVCLVRALPAASAQTTMRMAIVWLPVLVLSAQRDVGASAAYKIGVSLALGVCAVVPFHKQTMLSLERHTDARTASQLAAGAVLLATVGAVLLIVLAQPLTAVLYRREFGAMAQYLPAFGVFVVLQVLADVLLVRLMTRRADRALMLSCGVAIAAAVAALYVAPPAWLPALTLAAFVAAVHVFHGPRAGTWLPLRAAVFGVAAALASAMLPGGIGAGAAVAIVAGAFGFDGELREALLTALAQVLGRARL